MATSTLEGRVLYQDERLTVRVRDVEDGQRQITLEAPPGLATPRRRSIVTRYPLELIQAVLDVKGPDYLVDEIARDHDPGYTQAYLALDIPAYVPAEKLASSRILDFGCGAGASTIVIHRIFPEADVVGVELHAPYLEVARQRQAFYGIENISFLQSPGPNRLPEDLGTFDVVMLSAVYEHLLPQDRSPVLDKLFSVLRPGGVLIIDQLPHRWFPLESHTTFLPFLNYLPAAVAKRLAQLSPRVRDNSSWEHLLGAGIRGGTTKDIVGRLRRLGYGVDHLKPTGAGVSTEVELWFKGPSYEGYGPLKPAWRKVAELIERRFGVAFVPYIAIALRKTADRT